MGDGVSLLYQKGVEYENIFPFWDWKKIPGTTVHQDDEPMPLLLADGYFIQSDFVGGVSDGEDGIAVMDYRRDGLVAKKAWFMFNDMVVCLGAGICSSEGIPLTTSVEQSYYRETAVVKTKKGLFLPRETEEYENPIWILHNSTGFFFPEGGSLVLEKREVEGSWKRYALNYPDEKIYSEIFKLWFDHGTNPVNGSYNYIIVPNTLASKLLSMENQPVFSINNSANLQEVVNMDGNLAGFVFYAPMESDVFGGIKVNKPCLVMLKKDQESIRVSVSDPTQKLDNLQLTIRGNFQAANAEVKEDHTIVNILLPQGGDAGKTTTIVLRDVHN